MKVEFISENLNWLYSKYIVILKLSLDKSNTILNMYDIWCNCCNWNFESLCARAQRIMYSTNPIHEYKYIRKLFLQHSILIFSYFALNIKFWFYIGNVGDGCLGHRASMRRWRIYIHAAHTKSLDRSARGFFFSFIYLYYFFFLFSVRIAARVCYYDCAASRAYSCIL